MKKVYNLMRKHSFIINMSVCLFPQFLGVFHIVESDALYLLGVQSSFEACNSRVAHVVEAGE